MRLTGDVAGNRILTLTGPGGSGKTRLALGVAQPVRDRFPHGTWFVDLAAVRDTSMLEPAIASTLGLRDSAERSMTDALRAHLRERAALLVLDNLEQLLPPGADVVASIARGAPEVRFLITSRELLRIGGERGYPVPPLGTDAGVALFEARATALRPDLALGEDGRAIVRQICERLFGLPLAIELAAARVRLLSPALILERLTSSLDLAGGSRDLPERQRTLRGAMAWSHDLLAEPERRLFRRLGVFAGGWTAELAAQVADPDGDLGVDILEGLESLADKSLVRIEAAAARRRAPGPLTSRASTCTRCSASTRSSGWTSPASERSSSARTPRPSRARRATGARILGPAGGRHPPARPRAAQRPRGARLGGRPRRDSATGRSAPARRSGAGSSSAAASGRAEPRSHGRSPTPPDDLAPPIRALAAEGGLAYWADDFEAARRAYRQRLDLAEESGDPRLRADAHYDLGFMSMVFQDRTGCGSWSSSRSSCTSSSATRTARCVPARRSSSPCS